MDKFANFDCVIQKPLIRTVQYVDANDFSKIGMVRMSFEYVIYLYKYHRDGHVFLTYFSDEPPISDDVKIYLTDLPNYYPYYFYVDPSETERFVLKHPCIDNYSGPRNNIEGFIDYFWNSRFRVNLGSWGNLSSGNEIFSCGHNEIACVCNFVGYGQAPCRMQPGTNLPYGLSYIKTVGELRKILETL